MSKNSIFNILSLSAGVPVGSSAMRLETPTGANNGAPLNGFQSITTTPEATLTFAGAPAAVTAVWKVLSVAWPPLASYLWFPILLSLALGTAIYLQGRPPASSASNWSGLAFAVVNSFTIAATVLGINLAITPHTT